MGSYTFSATNFNDLLLFDYNIYFYYNIHNVSNNYLLDPLTVGSMVQFI